jgi:hypothetical protein
MIELDLVHTASWLCAAVGCAPGHGVLQDFSTLPQWASAERKSARVPSPTLS